MQRERLVHRATVDPVLCVSTLVKIQFSYSEIMGLAIGSIVWIAVKQLSKPLSRSIARNSQHNIVLRNYVLLPLGQLYHRVETSAKMWNQGFTRPKSIPPLNDETAIKYSSDMVSEFLIFVVATLPILISWYQSNKASGKEKSSRETFQEESLEKLSTQLFELTLQLDRQAVDLRNFERRLGDLDTRVAKLYQKAHKPWYHFW